MFALQTVQVVVVPDHSLQFESQGTQALAVVSWICVLAGQEVTQTFSCKNLYAVEVSQDVQVDAVVTQFNQRALVVSQLSQVFVTALPKKVLGQVLTHLPLCKNSYPTFRHLVHTFLSVVEQAVHSVAQSSQILVAEL